MWVTFRECPQRAQAAGGASGLGAAARHADGRHHRRDARAERHGVYGHADAGGGVQGAGGFRRRHRAAVPERHQVRTFR